MTGGTDRLPDTVGRLADLQTRVGALERLAAGLILVLPVVAMIIGGFLTWYVEGRRDEHVVRLFTFAAQLGAELSSTDSGAGSDVGSDTGFGIVLIISYVLLDLVSLTAVVLALALVGRAAVPVRLARVVSGALVVVVLGALTTTAVAFGADDVEVHAAAILLYTCGALATAFGLGSSRVRAWCQPIA